MEEGFCTNFDFSGIPTSEMQQKDVVDEHRFMGEVDLVTLSYKLRGSLTPIVGWVQLLLDREFDRDATLKALEAIDRGARLQLKLLEELSQQMECQSLCLSEIQQRRLARLTGKAGLMLFREFTQFDGFPAQTAYRLVMKAYWHFDGKAGGEDEPSRYSELPLNDIDRQRLEKEIGEDGLYLAETLFTDYELDANSAIEFTRMAHKIYNNSCLSA